jgi:fumarate reductase flavoprotein subunit
LRSACDKKNVDIVCHRRAYLLHKNGLQVNAVGVIDPSGVTETIGCKKLILACNGFGGNRQLVSQHLPSISEGMWFGHDGNQGEAVLWAQQLGASLKHLGAFQGHGNVAHPHGILITWAVITQGGVQVNILGKRFWDESQGYSEAARAVLAQPEGKAVTIFDERIAQVARQFEDFRQAESVHAVVKFNTLIELAEHFALPIASLEDSLSASTSNNIDEFGRRFCGRGLSPPYYAVRVTGALFHTQGGLEVDEHGRVRHENGQLFSNLYAGGGAACGVSGEGDSGYLSGNGLLSAVVLGYRAGKA